MSYDYDPNRNQNGQFNNLFGDSANTWEQQQAGVNHGDTLSSAYDKVQAARRLQGLDPITGQRPADLDNRPRGYEDLSTPIDESKIGEVLMGVFKWVVLFPALFILVAGGLIFGAVALDRKWMESSPEGGVVRMAARAAFPAASLPAPSLYATPKELDNTMNAKELVAASVAYDTRARIAPGSASRPRLVLSAYACQLDPACRAAVAAAGSVPSVRVMNWGIEFLMEKAKRGDKTAQGAVCLIPLLTDPTQHAALSARNVCNYANREMPRSPSVIAALNTMGSSSGFMAAVSLGKVAGLWSELTR
jgi:hypothetical protein